MTNPLIILNAWYEVLKGNTTEEHRRRSKICKSCKHSIHKNFLELIGDELKETKGMVCGLCKCPLSAKIRSTDICDKWKQPTK